MIVKDDEELAQEVLRAIGMVPGVDERQIQVTVDRGRVRLQGVVRSAEEKQQAMAAVVQVAGARSIDDAIAVETESDQPFAEMEPAA
jgi:osmotically-inducible protein OsmY